MATPTSTPPISRSRDQRGRALVAFGIVAAGVASFAVTKALVREDEMAELVTVQDVPADVAAEIDTVWMRFSERFEARRGCIDDVSVELVRTVDGGDARYVVGRSLIEIKIPTTPARFRESLAHELAHHIEHTCADFGVLRDEIHPRFGGPDRPWAGADVWEETPSELWAEAVVELVNGERLRHADEVPIDADAVVAIADWGRDG